MLWLACEIICWVPVFTEFCAEMVRVISASGKQSAHWSSALCPDFDSMNLFLHCMNPLPPISKIIILSDTFSCMHFLTFQIASSQLILYMVLHNSFFPFERKGDKWSYAECPTIFLPDFTGLLIGIFWMKNVMKTWAQFSTIIELILRIQGAHKINHQIACNNLLNPLYSDTYSCSRIRYVSDIDPHKIETMLEEVDCVFILPTFESFVFKHTQVFRMNKFLIILWHIWPFARQWLVKHVPSAMNTQAFRVNSAGSMDTKMGLTQVWEPLPCRKICFNTLILWEQLISLSKKLKRDKFCKWCNEMD